MAKAKTKKAGASKPRASGSDLRLKQIADEVAACKDEDGNISRRAVWQAAKADPSCALYGEFNWNVQEAAESHWDERAGEIIRLARSVFHYEEEELIVPRFVSNPKTMNAPLTYRETADAARESRVSKTMQLEGELSRIKNAVHRAMTLAKVFGLEHYFADLLLEVVRIETELGERSKSRKRKGTGTRPSMNA